MKTLSSVTALLIALLMLSSPAFAEDGKAAIKPGQAYGKGVFQTAPVKLAELMKDFPKFKGQKVVTQGEVYEVCTMEGCWLKVQDGDSRVRVVMLEHGFTVPKEIKGKTVQLEGIMEQKEMPAAMIRHYMKDEGKSQKEIDAVKTPQMAFQFIATGVKAI
jgi:hypothetical protein